MIRGFMRRHSRRRLKPSAKHNSSPLKGLLKTVLNPFSGFAFYNSLGFEPQVNDASFVISCAVLMFTLSACSLRMDSSSVADTSPTLPLPTPVVIPNVTPTPPLDSVTANVRRIFAVSQVMGNRPDVFSKVGDSITVSENFLIPIGEGKYQLGENYAYLQGVIDYYSVTEARPGQGNSFRNFSLAARTGWAAFQALDPANAYPGCAAGEEPLRCEYRLVKPSVALIMFGTNDIGYRTLEEYRADLDRVIEVSLQMGVIPVLSTIPPRPNMLAKVEAYNRVVMDVAAARELPVWDYYGAMVGLPNYGLTFDGVHPSSPPRRYDDAAIFTQSYLQYGYVMRNLTALQTLHALREMIGDGTF